MAEKAILVKWEVDNDGDWWGKLEDGNSILVCPHRGTLGHIKVVYDASILPCQPKTLEDAKDWAERYLEWRMRVREVEDKIWEELKL